MKLTSERLAWIVEQAHESRRYEAVTSAAVFPLELLAAVDVLAAELAVVRQALAVEREDGGNLEVELGFARKERDRAVDTANVAYSYDSAVRQENRQLREALKMLWDHYLLVISDEQKAQVQDALAGDASAAR